MNMLIIVVFPDSQHYSGTFVVASLEDINAVIIGIFRSLIYCKRNIVFVSSLLYRLQVPAYSFITFDSFITFAQTKIK